MGLLRQIGVTGAALLIAFACVVVMVLFVIGDVVDDRRTTRERDTARLAACLNFNRDVAGNVNALNDRTQELLEQSFNAPRETPRDPDTQALIDRFLVDQKRLYEAVKVPLRDCSPGGIETYYADPPVSTPPTTHPVPFQGDLP